MAHGWSNLANLNRFLVFWIFIFRMLKSNIEVRKNTKKFLTAKLD